MSDDRTQDPETDTGGTIAVIGAGTMGRGIALTALQHGYQVVAYDSDLAIADQMVAFIRARQEIAMSYRSEEENSPPGAWSLTVQDHLEFAVSGADVVIESVIESEPVKAAVLRTVGEASPMGTLLTTNTSTLSIQRLAMAASCEGRLVGMHFFNPADKMRLVEIVIAPGTPSALVRRCEALAQSLGKTTIVVKDSPGFVTSRLGLVLGNEAMRLVQSRIATPEAIDTAMRLGYNHPMGPLELADLVGLDARLNNLRSIHSALGDEAFRPLPILVELVEAGHFGRKTRRGFYSYDDQGRKLGSTTPPARPTQPGSAGSAE